MAEVASYPGWLSVLLWLLTPFAEGKKGDGREGGEGEGGEGGGEEGETQGGGMGIARRARSSSTYRTITETEEGEGEGEEGEGGGQEGEVESKSERDTPNSERVVHTRNSLCQWQALADVHPNTLTGSLPTVAGRSAR